MQVDLALVGGVGRALAHAGREPGSGIGIGPHAAGGLDELAHGLEVLAPHQQVDVAGGALLRVGVVEGGQGQALEHPLVEPARVDQLDHLDQALLLPHAHLVSSISSSATSSACWAVAASAPVAIASTSRPSSRWAEHSARSRRQSSSSERLGGLTDLGGQTVGQHPPGGRREVVVPARRSRHRPLRASLSAPRLGPF